MHKLPPFLIKKIFPPGKSVYTVDADGDGKVDSLLIKALNLIVPFTIPNKIELGQFDVNNFDLSEHATICLDGKPINVSKSKFNLNVLQDRMKIILRKKIFSVQDILANKAGGLMVAMGDTISILFTLSETDAEKLTKGDHIFSVEAEKIPKLEISFKLTPEMMNIKFDPKKL